LGGGGFLGEWCGGLGRGSGPGFGFFSFGQLGGHGSAGQGNGVVVDGGESAEKEAGEIAEDGGSATRDGVGSEENVEVPQGIVDSFSVLEVARVLEELQGEVIGPVRLRLGMTRTEHSSRIKNSGAAFSTGGREVEATMVAGNLFCGCRFHFVSLSLRMGCPPRVFFDQVRSLEI
jgi:hypothetical protein